MTLKARLMSSASYFALLAGAKETLLPPPHHDRAALLHSARLLGVSRGKSPWIDLKERALLTRGEGRGY